MAGHLLIRPQAAWDLDDHAMYLGINASPTIANRFQRMVEKTFAQILDAPELGSPWESSQEALQGVRFRLVHRFKNHVVFYRVIKENVEIVRVMHGSQDLKRHLEETDE